MSTQPQEKQQTNCIDLFPLNPEDNDHQNAQGELTGLIFNIRGHSVHDGPGARTTVFMCGCPLRCNWCCNPEGLFARKVLMTKSKSCVGCGRCVRACPRGGMKMSAEGTAEPIREICDNCTTFECVEACYKEGIYISGKEYTISDMMRIFQRDRQFWGSTGGVSFSGGEPLMQKKFMLALLKKCKEMKIHTCVETTACLAPAYFQEVISYVDWVFVDLKHMDPEVHKKYTGVSNKLTLDNIRALAARKDWNGIIMPRIPIIPGVNDSDENMVATANYLKDIGLDAVNLLPFHRLGESKYRQLGREYVYAEEVPPAHDYMQRLQKIMIDQGLICYVGWETPF